MVDTTQRPRMAAKYTANAEIPSANSAKSTKANNSIGAAGRREATKPYRVQVLGKASNKPGVVGAKSVLIPNHPPGKKSAKRGIEIYKDIGKHTP
jgi:hypothetical protein